MKTSLIVLLLGAAAATAHGADPVISIKIQETPPAKATQDKTPPPPAPFRPVELYRAETAEGVRARRSGHAQYSGVVIQGFQGNPLQLINPFAPMRSGGRAGNTAREPAKGELAGFKLLAVGW